MKLISIVASMAGSDIGESMAKCDTQYEMSVCCISRGCLIFRCHPGEWQRFYVTFLEL